MSETPALRRLFGLYFNEDWADDYTDEDQTIEDFARNHPAPAALVSGEIGRLLNRTETEAELEDELDNLGLGYWPMGDDPSMTWRAWLTSVAARVEELLQNPPARPTPPGDFHQAE